MVWGIIAVVISLGELAIGLAVGALVLRPKLASGAKQTSPSRPPRPVAATPTPTKVVAVSPAPKPEQVEEVLSGLQEFTTQIQDILGRHCEQVGSAQSELEAVLADQPGAESLKRLVGQLVDANGKLKEDLVVAQLNLREREQQLRNVQSEARTDALTGLPNRRDFNEHLSRRLAEWWRRGTAVSLVMIDVDFFKKFNDTYGHQAGDAVLQGVAQVLRDTMREMDFVARFGGEEFSVLLSATTLTEGTRAVQRALDSLRSASFHLGDQVFHATASMGLAQAVEGEDSESLIGRADAALYAAKKAGRDRGWLHDAEQCREIDAWSPEQLAKNECDRRNSPRRAMRIRQLIAPGNYTTVPPRDAFRLVNCCDISTSGISYVESGPPAYQTIVVALGVAPRLTYLKAEVVYVLTVDEGEGPQQRVGCRFVGRLDDEQSAK